jgi:exodeoxyribonuclease V gamma subunit
LQPFGRQYFEEDSALFTYAMEWRAAHAPQVAQDGVGDVRGVVEPMAPFVPTPNIPLTLDQLTQFLRNPVKAFFKHRLQVVFEETQEEDVDDESFGIDGLQQYGLIRQLLATAITQPDQVQEKHCVEQSLGKLRKSGVLPFKGFGDLEQQSLEETLSTMLGAWREQRARFPETANRQSVHLEEDSVVLEDWIDHLRSGGTPQEMVDPDSCAVAWLELQPSKLLFQVKKDYFARPEKLIMAWVRSLAIGASGTKARGILVGRDGFVEIPPMPQDQAIENLKGLLQLWCQGMNSPLPLPHKTALAFVAEKDALPFYEGDHMSGGEVDDPCLARMFPDYEALVDDGEFEALAKTVYAPLLAWATNQVKVAVHATELESAEEAA